MKYMFLLFASFLFLQSCNNENRGGEKDPSVMQPPSEAIPDSMQITNDSLISPDTVPNNGSQVGASDSIQRNK